MQHIIYVMSLAALLAGTAQAQTYERADRQGSNFAGVEVGKIKLRQDEFLDLDFTTFTGRIGHDFNRWLGLELRGGTTLSDETLGIESSIQYFFSGLVRVGWLPIDDTTFGIYGMGGYTFGRAEAQFLGIKPNRTAADFSWGAGGEFRITEHHGVNIEYLRYLDRDIKGYNIKVEHFGIGYVYRF